MTDFLIFRIQLVNLKKFSTLEKIERNISYVQEASNETIFIIREQLGPIINFFDRQIDHYQ